MKHLESDKKQLEKHAGSNAEYQLKQEAKRLILREAELEEREKVIEARK